MPQDPDPVDFLPLRPVELQILVSLTQGERHGYAILQEAEARPDAVVPGLATLYRALQRLESRGLLEGEDETTGGPGSERRRYRLTRLGRAVVRAEVGRVAGLVDTAREALSGGDER